MTTQRVAVVVLLDIPGVDHAERCEHARAIVRDALAADGVEAAGVVEINTAALNGYIYLEPRGADA